MKIQFLNGGLANQVFQYIFYRYAELSLPGDEPWFLDDSFFFVHDVHNGYELERVFGLHPKLLSEFFDADVWEYMIREKREHNKSIPQQLLENGMEISMVAEADNVDQWNPFSGKIYRVPNDDFYPELIRMPGDIYYHGYWIRKEWLDAYREVFAKELSFPEIDAADARNCGYLEQILGCTSVSIHIRRGDYVKEQLAWAESAFRQMIESVLRQVPEAVLFVFSDDPAWCREHREALGFDLPHETVIVEGNQGPEAFRDLQLMTSCEGMCLSNSAFCYLAALLNTRKSFVINPTRRQI